jgi:hypothetical protein
LETLRDIERGIQSLLPSQYPKSEAIAQQKATSTQIGNLRLIYTETPISAGLVIADILTVPPQEIWRINCISIDPQGFVGANFTIRWAYASIGHAATLASDNIILYRTVALGDIISNPLPDVLFHEGWILGIEIETFTNPAALDVIWLITVLNPVSVVGN